LAYLDILEKFEIEPNFYCSAEYFQRAGWQETSTGGRNYILNEKGEIMLPPISDIGGFIIENHWASLPEADWVETDNLLDYEFIYKPLPLNQDFPDLPGPEYKTSRKNIRKFLQSYDPLYLSGTTGMDMTDIIAGWLDSKEGEEIHDGETMMNYIENSTSKLYVFSGNRPVGLIIYDSNYKYINFRYCFVEKDMWGLSEYARLYFHMYAGIFCPGKMINDGGSLDNENLHRFKKRLNPYKINKIYTLLG
jgi:hypothetical protein